MRYLTVASFLDIFIRGVFLPVNWSILCRIGKFSIKVAVEYQKVADIPYTIRFILKIMADVNEGVLNMYQL